jgi:tellurite resistance protein TerC
MAALLIIVQLVFLEGILSLDNAAVLGAMVAVLPAHAPVPWPRPLHLLGRRLDRVLGGQRAAALKVGLVGAYVGRGVMLLSAALIIRHPWLRLLGAAYLLRIAIAHLGQDQAEEPADNPGKRMAGKHFWEVVLAVELADLAFSLDNVVAAVALSREFWVVMTGVALGILTMRFAAQVFTALIGREPVLAPAAYVLVLAIGLEILLAEGARFLGFTFEIASLPRFLVSAAIIGLALLYAHTPGLQARLQGPLRTVHQALVVLNQGLEWALTPVRLMGIGLVVMGRSLLGGWEG